jgi:isopentenyldiphosphate isomerase
VGIGVIILSICAILSDLYARKNADGSEFIDLSEDGRVNNSVSTDHIISIDKAHNMGLRHRGVWLHIVNEDKELLLLKRRKQAVTCPASWNAPGEHTKHLESYADTAYRGLSEELRLNRTQVLALVPLTPAPVLLEIQYMPPLRKRDAQWTQSFLVRVDKDSVRHHHAEATAMQWVPLEGIEAWVAAQSGGFCEVQSFVYSSEEQQVVRRSSSFQEMLLLHARLIQSELAREAAPKPP